MSTKSLGALAAVALAPFAAAQTSIPAVVVTVENAQPGRGALLTPPWMGIHDGAFDTYDEGSAASGGIEAIAEDGNAGPLSMMFASHAASAPQVVGLPGPSGPLSPGQRTSTTVLVDPMVDRYFSYVSMIIPSNDFFIANGNPMAHPLFDVAGNFIGAPFVVSGDETHDAGTEVNDELFPHVAFLGQAAPNTGQTEGGVVTSPASGFAAPGTLTPPDGVLNLPIFGNMAIQGSSDRVARFHFRYVDLGADVRYRAELSPSAEVQADEVVSPAEGLAWAISIDGDRLGLRLDTQGLSGPIQAAHLHLGPEGSNGPVVANLGTGLAPGGENARIVLRMQDLTGPLAGQSFVDFLREVAAGNVYVNVHTMQYPGGELRGQLRLMN